MPTNGDMKAPDQPSSLYRANLWRLGQQAARCMPSWLLRGLLQRLATSYFWLNTRRRDVVINNLAPALDGDRKTARILARQLFQQFATKLIDLWRYESGLPIDNLFHDLNGWKNFQAAHHRGNGVLLLTLHLGNWEFGAPLLTERGVNLQVITQAEPQAALTRLRETSRAKWGVDTLELGRDPFSAVEIIRRLQDNHCVALLMDRPPRETAVTVRLFGRPFHASLSAAELARATGCALLPVYLPRNDQGYVAHILPEVPYERQELRDPRARQALTQSILNSFEPAIRLYLNQWYHFVPIWPEPEPATP